MKKEKKKNQTFNEHTLSSDMTRLPFFENKIQPPMIYITILHENLITQVTQPRRIILIIVPYV